MKQTQCTAKDGVGRNARLLLLFTFGGKAQLDPPPTTEERVIAHIYAQSLEVENFLLWGIFTQTSSLRESLAAMPEDMPAATIGTMRTFLRGKFSKTATDELYTLLLKTPHPLIRQDILEEWLGRDDVRWEHLITQLKKTNGHEDRELLIKKAFAQSRTAEDLDELFGLREPQDRVAISQAAPKAVERLAAELRLLAADVGNRRHTRVRKEELDPFAP